MAGRRTASLGRILSTFGWIWVLAAIVTAFVSMDAERVPFLPGIAIYIVGKTMSALGKRGASMEGDPSATQQPTASVDPMPSRQRPVEERPVSHRNEYLEERRAPDLEPESGFEIPDLEEAILDTPPPMTSDEMVAEARRRFGPRPPEDED